MSDRRVAVVRLGFNPTRAIQCHEEAAQNRGQPNRECDSSVRQPYSRRPYLPEANHPLFRVGGTLRLPMGAEQKSQTYFGSERSTATADSSRHL